MDEMLRHLEVLASVVRNGKAALSSDALNRYAGEHATELLAEAAEKTSHAFKTANPGMPWDRLHPLRHDVAHPYDLGAEPVNINQLWVFATKDAPRISRRLRDARFP
ncbi:MAG: HepT-like ribonuclease domain-containing protein [Thermoplasmata archaeon]